VKQDLVEKSHWQDSGDLAMMFRGTYTSDFYRAIRDLLHEQVSLPTPAAPQHGDAYHRARGALERRWLELLSRERQYRSADGHAAALQARPRGT
jgi:anaerobic magnesium-protoporphyrin IX monomethyl ester cyclase